MPIYEYQCGQCQKVHEVMQKLSDAPMTECPDCKGPTQKIMSNTSFVLKGSGWYTTDYKKSSSPAPSSTATAPSAPATTASAPTKTTEPTKPA